MDKKGLNEITKLLSKTFYSTLKFFKLTLLSTHYFLSYYKLKLEKLNIKNELLKY